MKCRAHSSYALGEKFKSMSGFHRRLLSWYEVNSHFQHKASSTVVCSTLKCAPIAKLCGLGPPLHTPHLYAEPLLLSYFLRGEDWMQEGWFLSYLHMLYTSVAPCVSVELCWIALAIGRKLCPQLKKWGGVLFWGALQLSEKTVIIAQIAVISKGRVLAPLQGAGRCDSNQGGANSSWCLSALVSVYSAPTMKLTV